MPLMQFSDAKTYLQYHYSTLQYINTLADNVRHPPVLTVPQCLPLPIDPHMLISP